MNTIRAAENRDRAAIWAILEPIFRAGDTYAIDRDISRNDALEFWCEGGHTAYICEAKGRVLGTYYICANQQGGGNHVCNCGFATAPAARGKGLARQMLAHAQETARASGYHAMQFNFVLETNLGALKIWADNGFDTVGCLPKAFNHPTKGVVDALILYKHL